VVPVGPLRRLLGSASQRMGRCGPLHLNSPLLLYFMVGPDGTAEFAVDGGNGVPGGMLDCLVHQVPQTGWPRAPGEPYRVRLSIDDV